MDAYTNVASFLPPIPSSPRSRPLPPPYALLSVHPRLCFSAAQLQQFSVLKPMPYYPAKLSAFREVCSPCLKRGPSRRVVSGRSQGSRKSFDEPQWLDRRTCSLTVRDHRESQVCATWKLVSRSMCLTGLHTIAYSVDPRVDAY